MERELIPDVKSHYNSVSEAWRFIFGDNFHLGYFKSNDMNLSEATNALIDELSQLGTITKNSHLLDVGCGIGEPALYLHEKYHCTITGITISEKGVELATKKCVGKGYSHRIKFQRADALDNKLPDKSFDVVWVMESSHTMKDKEKLFAENYRVLKDNSTMLLCDMILKRAMNEVEIFNYRQDITVLEKVCGKAKTETLDYYQKKLEAAGFSEVETIDISEKVFPTMAHWRKNITQNYEKIRQIFPKEKIDEFLRACDITEEFYRNSILGYGLVKAVKKHTSPNAADQGER
jgi:27-O-demethylrifamycin SV methyltransferase